MTTEDLLRQTAIILGAKELAGDEAWDWERVVADKDAPAKARETLRVRACLLAIVSKKAPWEMGFRCVRVSPIFFWRITGSGQKKFRVLPK